LLAPTLNFSEFFPPEEKVGTSATLIIGNQDTVTPPDRVLPLAEKLFFQLKICRYDHDHLQHDSFTKLDWHKLLNSRFQ